MALVIVATPGASTANSYVTLAEAETFVLEFLNTTTWAAATNATKNAALVEATHDIDCLSLIGTPDGEQYDEEASDYQPLHFPTTDDFDDTDTAYIPDDVKRATVVQAMYLIRAGEAEQASQDIMAQGIVNQNLGRLSQSYSPYRTSPVCEVARRHLKKWLTATRKIEFGV